MEYSQRIKVIIGVTQNSRAELGSTGNKVFSKVGPKGKRNMVSEEIRMSEEEKSTASAVTQAKQCARTKWNDIERIKLSKKSLIAMVLQAISFLLRYTYDLLRNATNLKLRGYTDSDMYLSCKSGRGILRHVLSACLQSLQMYTWWYNNVLEVIIVFSLQTTAQYASSWIRSKARSFQHEWNARGTTIPGWLRKIRKR